MGTDSLNSVPITLLTKSHGPPSMRCSGFRGINAIPSLGGFMCGYIRILVQGKRFIYLQGYLYSNNTSRSRREFWSQSRNVSTRLRVQGLPGPERTDLFNDVCKDIILWFPKNVGHLGI